MNKAIVTDIQRASVHDGPGLRTTVFFKGCPLNCVWCHNPESINPNPQIMHYSDKCIGCGKCEDGCFSGAKVVCGKEMTAEEIFAEILQDKPNYANNGGATFSGGEPLLYKEILKELILLCKNNGITTAIETSLFLFDPEILSSVDFVMADFKIWDGEEHKKYTGVNNDIIKENFKHLDTLNVPFVVRTPIIPTINDSIEEIVAIRDFIKDFKNILDYELLPYHPLGVTKQKALGLPETRFIVPENSKMEILRSYANIKAKN
ncbi:MAG: glycyl-radical enzyme activating protein [Clostridia bacterium]|nr:glycyl-radical enzyme activating protein [Clostridia bacterium]